MNDITEMIQQHCIAIDHDTGHGSGVLMSAITKDYSYVLTAKHVLQIDKKDESKGLRNANEIKLNSAFHGSLEIIQIYRHDSLDIAVIKIKYISDLRIYPLEEGLLPNSSVQLFGCRETKQVANYLLKLNSVVNGILEFAAEENTVQISDLKGFSGGGLFYYENGLAYLYGIETSASQQGEFVTRVKGIHISKFKELLSLKNLVNFGADHLAEFDSLISEAFSTLDTINKDGLKEVIALFHNEMSDRICPTSLTPYQILNQFKEKMLSYRQEQKELQEKELWKDFLEFLAIQVIVNPPKNFNDSWELKYIQRVFKSYRFLFSKNQRGWRSLYKDLVLPSNFKGLKPDGKIIILGDSGRLPNQPNIDHQYENTITDISSGLDREGIANTRYNKHLKNPIVHWHKLNDFCLAENQDRYADLRIAIANEEMSIRSNLKQDYGEYLLSEDD